MEIQLFNLSLRAEFDEFLTLVHKPSWFPITACFLQFINRCKLPSYKIIIWHFTNSETLAFIYSPEKLGPNLSEMNEIQMYISYCQILYLLHFLHQNLNFKVSIMWLSQPIKVFLYKACFVNITGVEMAFEGPHIVLYFSCFHGTSNLLQSNMTSRSHRLCLPWNPSQPISFPNLTSWKLVWYLCSV